MLSAGLVGCLGSMSIILTAVVDVMVVPNWFADIVTAAVMIVRVDVERSVIVVDEVVVKECGVVDMCEVCLTVVPLGSLPVRPSTRPVRQQTDDVGDDVDDDGNNDDDNDDQVNDDD